MRIRSPKLLQRASQASQLVSEFGAVDAVPTIRDIASSRHSIRFKRDGRTLRVARDGTVESTVRHLLRVDSLDRLAALVDDGDDVVLDIGAHSGLFSALVKARHPAARIVAVEANPSLHPVIRSNLEPFGNWDLLPFAVTDTTTEIPFFVNGRATQTSAINRESAEAFGRTTAKEIRVRATTLDRIAHDLKLERIDVVKMDIQGAEELAIAGGQTALKIVRKLIIEITFLDGNPEGVLRMLSADFGAPTLIEPVVGGADLLFRR